MLDVINVILYVVVVIIALLLIALILVQPSKSGGFGSAFGGVGESVFGAQAMSHLSKVTVVLISIFFALTLILVIISGHKTASTGSLLTGAADKKEVPSEIQNVPDDSAEKKTSVIESANPEDDSAGMTPAANGDAAPAVTEPSDTTPAEGDKAD